VLKCRYVNNIIWWFSKYGPRISGVSARPHLRCTRILCLAVIKMKLMSIAYL
jgi:hypothetical protein